MSPSWRSTRLGAALDLKRGYDLPQQSRRRGNVPIVSSSGVKGTHDEPRVKAPGVVIGRYGTLGEVFYVRDDFWPLNTTLYVRDFKGNDPRFISYLLQTVDVLAYSDKAAVPGINRNHVHDAVVDIPPLGQQRRIAEILGALDDKIELNRRMNETLEAITRTVFKAWFIDHETVREDAWIAKTWGDLVTLEYGKSLQNYNESEGQYAVYGTNGLIGRTAQPLCRHEGIIIGRKGAYRGIHFSAGPFFAIDTAFYVEPKVPLEMRWAYYEMLRLDINGMDSGSAIPSTSRGDFYALPVLEPPIDLQRSFVSRLSPAWERQRANEAENSILSQLRDTLLPKLLSGEIRVGAAEREVAEVV